MPKGVIHGSRPFKPGQRANPKGRPPTPPEVREVRKLNKHDVELSLTSHLRMTRDQIADVIEDPNAKMLDVLVASIIAKAVQTGDQQRLDFIFNRTIGKVSDQIEISDNRMSIMLAYNPKERILAHGQTKEISSGATIDIGHSGEGSRQGMAPPVQVGREADAQE